MSTLTLDAAADNGRDDLYDWSDPHPSVGGAAVPLQPAIVKVVARWAGRRATSAAVIESVRRVAPAEAVVEMVEVDNRPFLKMLSRPLDGKVYPVHCFCLLKARRVRPPRPPAPQAMGRHGGGGRN